MPLAAETPVVLMLGAGVDSAAIAARWLVDPSSRDFDLADAVAVHAVVGEEYAQTQHLMERHLLPLMRGRLRLVQLARAGQSTASGYVVLDDSLHPERFHLRGPWRLSDELLAAGTVPQVASKRRWCSYRAKGENLDRFLADEFGHSAFRHCIGFATEEMRRVERDQSYTVDGGLNRRPEYPLIDWGWSRQDCELFLLNLFGEPWARSCCGFCPFAAPRSEERALIERWKREPQQGARALFLEYVSLTANERSMLFGTRSAIQLARRYELVDVLERFGSMLAETPWAVYHVRRIFFAKKNQPLAKGPAWRSVRKLGHGSWSQMRTELEAYAAAASADIDVDEFGIARARVRRPQPPYPTVEETFALSPAVITSKERSSFPRQWSNLTDDRAPRPSRVFVM